ncbi:RNA polymerase sigma factor [Streptomyces fulvoviolaceus]|uniref:RNA polymerase sigma factor n=1 Tax=Streptomyces fulvoviolaceus TaxID=285535 RepID=UPI0021C21ABA|nr:sigma-70 family RNA polymerase sigma factor [Streptomyces fulvoviolaceus]MCT9082094.1 sigma-70 family RNA polymerase sigma factor [Streptomyces fulvoviolaceus]
MTRIPPGHQAEVATLYREYRDGMVVFAARLLRHQRGAAHDVVQETFQAAALRWRQLRELDRAGQRAWLYRVLRNKIFDHWGTLRHLVDLPDDFEPRAAMDVQLVVASNLLVDKCWKVIDEMPQVRRRVALLKWQGEWTTREIGQHLGIEQSTVRVHLMEARNTLVRSLGAEITGGEEAE